MRDIRIAAAQFEARDADKEYNFERIETLARQSGRRVHLVGHSRGGQFARVAASRAADSVASLTTLGSPVGLYGLGTVALGLGAAVTLVGTLGVPGLATISCLVGGCCRDYRTGLGSRWPDDVPLTRILGSLSFMAARKAGMALPAAGPMSPKALAALRRTTLPRLPSRSRTSRAFRT